MKVSNPFCEEVFFSPPNIRLIMMADFHKGKRINPRPEDFPKHRLVKMPKLPPRIARVFELCFKDNPMPTEDNKPIRLTIPLFRPAADRCSWPQVMKPLPFRVGRSKSIAEEFVNFSLIPESCSSSTFRFIELNIAGTFARLSPGNPSCRNKVRRRGR